MATLSGAASYTTSRGTTLQFLREGVRRGEKALYITLSETREELAVVASSHGWSIDDFDVFEFSAASEILGGGSEQSVLHPWEMELSETVQLIQAEVERVQAIANVTLSPDGTRLYVTSEIADPGAVASGTANAVLAHNGCTQGTAATTGYGLLTVVDVAKAETTPTASAIIATVAAGCSPVRVVETADQQVIWVAARGDNRVLAFSTHMLETNPSAALLGYGDTGGIAPVGLQLFHGDTLLAVANSNRFSSPPTAGNMTILNATPVKPTIAQTVTASYFPRSVSVAQDGSTLYLTDYDNAQVQIVTTVVK